MGKNKNDEYRVETLINHQNGKRYILISSLIEYLKECKDDNVENKKAKEVITDLIEKLKTLYY